MNSYAMATPTSLPPRVLLIMPAQWPRALLRAALREAGYDALGSRALSTARRFPTDEPGRGPVRLILVDQEAFSAPDAAELEWLLDRHPAATAALLAPATRRPPEGPWKRVLRRPASVADVVALAETLVPLPSEARRPLD